MRTWLNSVVTGVGITGLLATPAAAAWPGDWDALCPKDAVKVGSFCMDKYEASVWEIPACTPLGASNEALVTKVRQGTAKQVQLVAGGAVRRGVGSDDYGCADNGQDCVAHLNFTTCTGSAIFAVSLRQKTPSAYITWFQAQQACSNAGKRLPSNAEWQQAVAGTPDPGPDNGTTDCNTTSGAATATGSRSSCVSSYGAFDMVGNVMEWVADWVPLSTADCPGWGTFSGDYMCLSGASTTATGPGALLRGGDFGIFFGGTGAGPLTVVGGGRPSFTDSFFGFRCAR